MQSNAPIDAPISWPLDKLLKGWVTLQTHHSETSITGLSLDSRFTKEGDLFVALQGLQQHGLEHASQAIKNGASALVWESSSQVNESKLPDNIPSLEIDNLQQKLGLICQRFYNISIRWIIVNIC